MGSEAQGGLDGTGSNFSFFISIMPDFGLVDSFFGLLGRDLTPDFFVFYANKYAPDTLPKTNSSHLKIGRAPKGKNRLAKIHFQVLCLAVSFREGNSPPPKKQVVDQLQGHGLCQTEHLPRTLLGSSGSLCPSQDEIL